MYDLTGTQNYTVDLKSEIILNTFEGDVLRIAFMIKACIFNGIFFKLAQRFMIQFIA